MTWHREFWGLQRVALRSCHHPEELPQESRLLSVHSGGWASASARKGFTPPQVLPLVGNLQGFSLLRSLLFAAELRFL